MSVLRDYAAAHAQPMLPLAQAEGSPPARFDEVVDAAGALRPAWKGLASVAVDLTAADLQRMAAEITALLADDGVTYEHADAGTQDWRLDPVPLVVDAATWAKLDTGLAQRAELLNALLVDLYGERTLLADGVIPSAAIFAHAGYARPMARPSARDPHPLILAGADLGRDAGGEWRVLTDRVQAPSGLGYAMENRRVISRVMPRLYQEAGLHRMEPYFSALRATLLHAAPGGVADPRVVVLSPGTHSETAYDQAFLANMLGFPLVQGNDLIVRDGWVWMNPGPAHAPVERVDVIVRRVDADWCDPLELRAGSKLGVAGLSEAVRRGHVRLVNGLGAGVVENPALIPYLPAVCERLLGEQLRLQGAPTWWAGEPEGLRVVLDAVSSAHSPLSIRTIDGPATDLEDLSRDELRRRILAAPYRYVGQERLPLSQAPAWASAEHGARGIASRPDAVRPHPLVLRTFTVRDGAAYRPLVGGLATLAEHAPLAPRTKDVWVLKARPTDPDQGLESVTPMSVARAIPVLSPRALQDMYWTGRYAERSESLLRLIITVRAYAEQLEYASGSDGAAVQRALLGALQRLAGQRWLDPDAELRSLLLDAGRPGSAAHSLDQMRDALEGVRDQLSGDTWRVFSITDRAAATLRASMRAPQIAESAERMLTGFLSLQGVTASMIRDDGWHTIEAGRYLERALQVCTLLAATTISTAGASADRAVLGGVLLAAESSVTHRRRYRGDVRALGVLELLLTDPDNPRSVIFALSQLRTHLASLPGSTGSTRPERLLEHLEDALETAEIGTLVAPIMGARPRLEDFLSGVHAGLQQLSDAIAHQHFESGPLPQAMSALTLTEEWGVAP